MFRSRPLEDPKSREYLQSMRKLEDENKEYVMLVYTSALLLPSTPSLLSSTVLNEIVVEAEAKNIMHGVGGALWFNSGEKCILQVLEGRQADVKALYSRSCEIQDIESVVSSL